MSLHFCFINSNSVGREDTYYLLINFAPECFHFILGSMKYPVSPDGLPAQERTRQTWDADVQAAIRTGKPSLGVKGPSPLGSLPEFDIIWGVSADYMHCILEGVTRQITELWLTSTHCPFYVGAPANVSQINERLTGIKPPQWFTRLPRSLHDRSFWKASEWKWWLLHYSIPCLHRILPEKYLRHFSLFVAGISLLLKDEVSPEDLLCASDVLCEFVANVEPLYGLPAMS